MADVSCGSLEHVGMLPKAHQIRVVPGIFWHFLKNTHWLLDGGIYVYYTESELLAIVIQHTTAHILSYMDICIHPYFCNLKVLQHKH